MTILLPQLSDTAFPTSKTVTVPTTDKKPASQYFSKTGTALCIYLLINVGLQIVLPHLTLDDHWSRTARAAIAQFKNLPRTPGIVFIGSSVMGRPIWCVDHAHYQIVPYPNHRQMKWLPNELAQSGLGDVQSFNLSLDAAMVSDVYLLCDKFLKGNRMPDLVIYGINRRDVLGSLFLCERTTPAFKLFFEPFDCWELSHLYSASIKERFELVLGELLPVYRYRQIFQEDSLKGFRRIRTLFSSFSSDQIAAIPEKKPAENQNALDESSLLPHAKDMGNFSTYTMDKIRLKNQEAVLKLMAQLFLKSHSHLLIVNMPLREDFLSKAKPVCTEYEDTLQACAKLPNTFLLDLDKTNESFGNDCFEDWFHLNAKGGQKALTRLVGWLKEHKECLEKVGSTQN
jgi:hypothetical protein